MNTGFFKGIISDRLRGKFFLTGAVIGLVVISAAWGQTSVPAKPVEPVGPGATASIGPAQGVKGAPVDAPHQELNKALTPETRQTLQEAMNAYGSATATADNSGPAGAVVLGPGEAAQLDGAGVNRIAFAALPDRVKGALGAPVHATLVNSQGR